MTERLANYIKLNSFVFLTLFCISYLISPQATLLMCISVAVFVVTTSIYLVKQEKSLRALYEQMRFFSTQKTPPALSEYEEGSLSLLHDEVYKVMSNLTELSESLETEKTRLVEAISDISHQFKTPLTSMRMMTELLELQINDDDEQTVFLSQLHQSLDRLQWLVNALLKLSKIEAHCVTFEKVPCSTRVLVKRAQQMIAPQIKEKSVDIVFEMDDEEFIGDLNWTLEAVVNVLKNAVEHTPEKKRIIIRSSKNALYTKIEIFNEGSMISAKDLPHLFTRFYKGENAHPDSVGIGLALAKSIMCSQSGDLVVFSSEAGTTFTFKFYVVGDGSVI